MTERERLLCVLQGKTPDQVPWFGDLSHWYQAEAGIPWNLYQPDNAAPELLALHREVKAGWYIGAPGLHEEHYSDGVERERALQDDRAVEQFHTPIGSLQMIRRWNQTSYSWDIVKHLVETPQDLEILTYAQERKYYVPRFDNWAQAEKLAGDIGLGFCNLAYTGLGSLISYYMGVAPTIYALADEPERTERYIRIYNEKHLELVRLYSQSPAPHMIFTDNLSSDVQSPSLFRQYSLEHYRNIADCLHAAGKTVSAHIDGRMGGLLGLLADAGIDVADACTPAPSGDIGPAEIRRQAGPRMIVMGGVSPSKWLPETPEKEFIEHVRSWLDLSRTSSRVIQSAGDQVPPGTKLQRIRLMADLVAFFGRYPDN
ncbi:MAG TPA: hypothetical protein DD640_10755 [Clostridiales bacterium]|nr:hypothetical protein [Clostridiales bacterium]